MIVGITFLLGTIAPSLVALALTARAEGRPGVLVLLGRIIRWRVSAKWYVFALGYFGLIKLTVALVQRIMTGVWPKFGQVPWSVMAIAIIFSTPVQAGEEIGWRGYALPRISERLGLGWASIILGVIWGCWHLPFFFIPQSDNAGQSFPVYVLAVTALSVAMAWLFWRTGGSLLLTMLMHASVNNTAGIVSSTPSPESNPFVRPTLVAGLTAGVLWLCAVFFLMRMSRAGSQLEFSAPLHGHDVDLPERLRQS